MPFDEPQEDKLFPAGLVSARPGAGYVFATFVANDRLHEPRWELSGQTTLQNGRVEFFEVCLRPHPERQTLPADGITAGLWDQIRWREIRRGIRRSLSEHARLVAIDAARSGVSQSYREHAAKAAAMVSGLDSVMAGPGRRGTDKALYRQLALRYLELQDKFAADGMTARGIVDVLQHEPWPVDLMRGITVVSKNTIKSRLRRLANDEHGMGYLTFDGGGRAGAKPGPLMIEEQESEELS